MGINFTLVFAPGLLEAAPHTHIATVHADREAEAELRSAIARAFPNVSAIGVRDVLNDVIAILRQIDAAVGGIAALALVAGLLVLAESVAAAQRRRVYDAVILKVLGATRRQLFRAYLLEHLILGAATALLAAGAGTLIGWIVTATVIKTPWSFQPALIGGTAVIAIVVTLAFGYWATWRALKHKAAPVLRSE
jgi:putative ABC transport system permease protein